MLSKNENIFRDKIFLNTAIDFFVKNCNFLNSAIYFIKYFIN